jgi:hypothetical protein
MRRTKRTAGTPYHPAHQDQGQQQIDAGRWMQHPAREQTLDRQYDERAYALRNEGHASNGGLRTGAARQHRHKMQHGAEDQGQDADSKSHMQRGSGGQNGAGAQNERQQETCSSGKA